MAEGQGEAKVQEDQGKRASRLIPLLQELQARHGYLPEEDLRAVAKKLGLPVSRVYGVATFYSQFSLHPRGKHLVQICKGTACHVQGSEMLVDHLKREFGLELGKPGFGGKVSLEVVRCLGCCSLAPVMMVDGVAYGRLTPSRAAEIVRSLVNDAKA
ncbi:MAG: NADH-quinone oxidoreductase subunit NuoE family protein [Candidatus Bipolaricaulaceae bacterium]